MRIRQYTTNKKTLFVYLTALTLVFSFGAARLLFPEASQTVRVSGVSVYDPRSQTIQNTWDQVRTNPEAFQAMSNKILNEFIGKTKAESTAGSKIVVWSEISPMMLYGDQQDYINRIKKVARENHVIIVAAPIFSR